MKQKHNKIRYLLLQQVLLLLFLTGCWSTEEIENRGLAVGIALDKAKGYTTEKELEDKGGGYAKRDLLTVTFQLASAYGTSTEGKGEGQQPKPYINISETGDSVHQMISELALRKEQPLFNQHLKVIVISADLVRDYSIDKLVDFILRDNEIRPSCLVLISSGEASKTLESKEAGEIPARRLMGIMDNQFKTTRIFPQQSLAKLTAKMASGSSFLMQNIISANGEVKIAGAAVIDGKTKQLAGFLTEEDVEGLTWITGRGKGGVIKSFDKVTGQLFTYEIESMKSNITSHINGSEISLKVSIETTGALSENWADTGRANNQFLKRAKKATEQKIKKLAINVTEKMQQDYHAEVAGFGDVIRIEHPKVWKNIKKDWDYTFRDIPINYNVKVTINDYGTLAPK